MDSKMTPQQEREQQHPSSIAELFVFELKKLLPPDQIIKLDTYDLSNLHFAKDHKIGYLCAKWAIDTTADQKHGEFKHLTTKLEKLLQTVKEAEWEVHFVTITKSVEMTGLNEALAVIEQIGKSKGWQESDWEGLLKQIIAESDEESKR